jgi:hypothetical protein
MEPLKKALSLMNFTDAYQVSYNEKLILSELNWLATKTGVMPTEALFIGYAYAGPDYGAYFQQVSGIFLKAGIKLTDITSGDPAALIGAAKLIVIGAGDINRLIAALNNLVSKTFNPYIALKGKIDSGTGFLGWNEGGAIVSPKYFAPPAVTLPQGIAASPFQIVSNFKNGDTQSRPSILNYLKNNALIKKVIAQTDQSLPDGTSVRLEESGGGMIDSATAPYPIVIRFEMKDGKLTES